MRLLASASAFVALALAAPAFGGVYDLTLQPSSVTAAGKTAPALSINGQIPGPLLRWREGEEVTLNVTNRLAEDASIHWHGIILPQEMDGVPGLSFDGIKPGQTFTYRFKVRQSGTYWYHSHSGLQEQQGIFAPIIIDPAEPDGIAADREYVVVLSDWLKENPYRALRNLKKDSGWYNYNRRTVGDLVTDLRRAPDGEARAAVVRDRLAWGRMRMDPTDLTDVSGYAFLVNGKDAAANWTALFRPGERVRLRFVNASAMTFYDVRIPGLKMTVVQADGQNVRPVEVDQFRMAMGETYDVIVQPEQDQAYTLFAQAFDRSGYARATLAPREGMTAPVPRLDPRPVRTLADMPMPGMKMAAGAHAGHGAPEPAPRLARHDMPGMEAARTPEMDMDEVAMEAHLHPGLTPPATVLAYDDLAAARAYPDRTPPAREVTIRLTGSMNRYYWSIDGRKWPGVPPLKVRYGERVRVRIVNETMMEHPMHLHGMWMDLVKADGALGARKHTVIVGPNSTVTADITVDALKTWAFHCHILFHAATGMMTTLQVAEVVAP
ncbi:copper resistance system multicopper oxidase [Phenylobacterium sp. CCH9-H3]|uniref:copper resistance system multicopper oxidase n=3 Tax=unclassified Phenylobacterium TaxID=2640670 RepID=UPI00083ADB81|nr:copper resistance system multicopper oxidase [Phenylobacterium sp. CCH9-H3]